MKSIFDLNRDLLNRYKTLIETIKTSNNTFYDAFNNFQEQLFKSVCNKENLTYPKGSITLLLDNKAIKYYLINEMKLNEKILDKMKDYALKINKHKHVNEKKLDIDMAISYMACLYAVINKINKYYNFNLWNINVSSYILKIYGQKEETIIDVLPISINKEEIDNTNDEENNNLSTDLNKVKVANFNTKNIQREKTQLSSLLSDKKIKVLKLIVLVSTVIMVSSNIAMCIFFAQLNEMLGIINACVLVLVNAYLVYSLIRMIKQKETFDIKDAKFLPVNYKSLEDSPFVESTILFTIIQLVVLTQCIYYALSIFSLLPQMIVCSILYIISAAVSVLLLKKFFKSYYLHY